MYIFKFSRKLIEKDEIKKRLKRLRSIDIDTSEDEDDLPNAQSQEDDDHLTTESSLRPCKSLLVLNNEKDNQHEFTLSDAFEFASRGVAAIADDQVTKRFSTEELQSWNLLTRTNKNYHHVSTRLMFLWSCGWVLRFVILFPMRMFIFTFGMLFLLATTALVGLLSEGPVKRKVYAITSVTSFRILSRALSSIIRFHDSHNKPKGGSLCVANHTSPLDVLILHCDNPYALVGQLHGGFLGFIENALSRATSHCFFHRTEVRDRSAVTRKMRDHVLDANKLPILIFPEGTCINNSAVMMFKKGSFEVADIVYPVAIKYDPIFCDPFWDSSKYGYFTYIMRMMTSWSIVCDVWYMKPMEREDHETSVDFACRVKAAIARRGGLVDLEWDGMLKRQKVKPDLMKRVQSEYSRKISVPLRPPDLSNFDQL